MHERRHRLPAVGHGRHAAIALPLRKLDLATAFVDVDAAVQPVTEDERAVAERICEVVPQRPGFAGLAQVDHESVTVARTQRPSMMSSVRPTAIAASTTS